MVRIVSTRIFLFHGQLASLTRRFPTDGGSQELWHSLLELLLFNPLRPPVHAVTLFFCIFLFPFSSATHCLLVFVVHDLLLRITLQRKKDAVNWTGKTKTIEGDFQLHCWDTLINEFKGGERRSRGTLMRGIGTHLFFAFILCFLLESGLIERFWLSRFL
ncbi:hypothetical protein MLD38_001484 [Melastoma candidum]|uniref:Uncharacterized protein n=1 Tax=Melastoma candidum TaxID=119954 RepID=A0ACB9SCS0_9MYRT|nr:hypothetical protein MLD38_001484 [Melastoma candidum]